MGNDTVALARLLGNEARAAEAGRAGEEAVTEGALIVTVSVAALRTEAVSLLAANVVLSLLDRLEVTSIEVVGVTTATDAGTIGT